MPYNKKDYPKDWDAIAFRIKERAGWVCQNCQRRCKKPDESWGDFIALYKRNGGDMVHFKKTQYVLTTAHLNHCPMDCRDENLRAWCSVCHLKYDGKQHAKTRKANRENSKSKTSNSNSQRGRRSKRGSNKRRNKANVRD